jgi:hypothetical protein
MIRTHLFLGVLVGGLALAPAASMASETRACPTEQVATPASSNWNFQREASQLLGDIQADAQGARVNADTLQTLTRDPMVDWHVDALYLSNISSNIEEMDRDVCRLESIHRVISPEEQQKTDEAAMLVREISINTNDAIEFLKEHREALWMPAYRTYAMNIYTEANELAQTMKKPVG